MPVAISFSDWDLHKSLYFFATGDTAVKKCCAGQMLLDFGLCSSAIHHF